MGCQVSSAGNHNIGVWEIFFGVLTADALTDILPDVPARSLRDLTDRLLDGKLDSTLVAWRREGLSYLQISKRLDEKHQISITDETARIWCQRAEALA